MTAPSWSPPSSDPIAGAQWSPPASDPVLAASQSPDAAAPAVPQGGAVPAGTIFNPTAGMSTTDNVVAGIGKGLVDTGRGVYQLGASIGHAAGLVSDERMAQIQQGVDEARQLDQPLMHTTAGKVGDIIGQAAPALLLPEAGVVGSAVEGGALGAAQPVASGQSRLQNAGMGALGGGAGAGAGKILSTVLGGFGGAGGRQAAVDLLDKEDIPTSVAQVTGAKAPQAVERASAITSDDAAEFAALQGQAFNRAVLRRVGVNDPTVKAATPNVIGPAKQAITNVMDGVASRTRPRVDNAFLNDLVGVQQDALRQLPASDVAPINQNIDDIITNGAANNGYLDGTFVQKLNSNLGALSRNPATAPIADDLQEAVHNVVQRYASPQDAAALSTAQRQYRALKQIEPAIDPATGNISIPKLMSSLNSKSYGSRNQTLYARGDQSLVDLARAAKQVIPDNLGNSGTAERTLPALTALEVAASGEPIKAGVKAAVGTLGLNAMGRAMRNQGVLGSYLKSGIPVARAAAPVVSNIAAPLGYGTGAAETASEPTTAPAYASGGKVDHEVLVSRLMDRWHAARKAAKKTTEPLLHVPDPVIARALEIAGRQPA